MRLPEVVRAIPRPIWIGAGASFLGFGSFYLLVAALPVYLNQLGYSAAGIGAVVGAGYVVNVAAYAFTAYLTDRRGQRGFVAATAAGLGASALVYTLAGSMVVFVVASVLQGLTMSAFATAITAYVGKLAPSGGRGSAIGFYSVFSLVAQAAAPPLGILCGSRAGYLLLFEVSAACGLAAAAVALLLPRPAMSASPADLRQWLGGLSALAAPGTVQLVVGVCRGVTLAFLPVYMIRNGVGNPGLFFTFQVVTAIVLRPLCGTLSDQYGRLALVLPGLLVAGAGILLIALPASYLTLTASGVLFGAAVAVLAPTVLAWAFDRTGLDQRGLASGVYNTCYDLGRAASALGLGALVAVAGFPAIFLTAGTIPVLAAGGMFIHYRTRMRRQADRKPPGHGVAAASQAGERRP
ncbi:MAG: MFS transporter [Nocardioidaceae bacterium]